MWYLLIVQEYVKKLLIIASYSHLYKKCDSSPVYRIVSQNKSKKSVTGWIT